MIRRLGLGMSTTPTVVAGRYRLLRQLGAGGMGQVYLAHDEMLDRHVAIKQVVLPPGLSRDEEAEVRSRTLREARTAAQLNHPSVVQIYDVIQAEEQPWIVMEYVPSRSLHEVINEDGPLEPLRAARIGLAVLDALTAAHDAGILHRDVKPGNVLLGQDGRVVLTDFGLATFDGEGAVTLPGLVFGSVRFVAPERARDGTSSPEADLWALGATLYAAVEGQSPYARSTAMETLTALAIALPDPLRPSMPPQHQSRPSRRPWFVAIAAVGAALLVGAVSVLVASTDTRDARPGAVPPAASSSAAVAADPFLGSAICPTVRPTEL